MTLAVIFVSSFPCLAEDELTRAGQRAEGVIVVDTTIDVVPLGFSKRGAFAFVTFTHDGYQQPHGTFTVVDLVADRVLDRVPLASVDDETLGELLQKNQATIDALLAARGIREETGEASRNGELGSRTFALSGERPVPPRVDGDDLKEARLVMSSPEGETKLLAKLSWGRSGATDRASGKPAVVGVVRSPHERRVAVILRTLSPGFENETRSEVLIVGAHLDRGLKRLKGEEHR